MSLSINPLIVIVPAWIAGLSLLGIARLIKHRAEKRLKVATIPVQNENQL
jgi:hypothetical protein